MADGKPTLDDVVQAAYEGLEDESEGTPEGEATDESTPPSDEGAQTEVESETESQESEAPEGTDDLPDRYFEVDLSGLPAEERRAVMDALRARDDKIGKLLRGEPREAASEEDATDEDPEPLSDADILSQLGIDPDDPFSEGTAKVAVPLARALEQANARLAAMEQHFELQALQSYWTNELDKLESDNGELPIERLAVLEFAATEGITTPEDAYWRIAGPARRQVEDAVRAAQARVEAARTKAKKDGSSTRPRASGAESEVVTKEARLRDAVKDSASRVLKDLGID